MKQALGLVEISGLSTAIVVADTMAKAANVRILEIESTKGPGCMIIKIIGNVGAVNAAVNAGKQIGTTSGKLISWKVIPRPSDYIDQAFCCSEPPVPSSPPKKEAQEETETGIEIKAEAMKAVKAGEPEKTGLEEIAPEDTEQETEAKPAETGPEPKTGAGPIEIKSELLVEAEPTKTRTVDPAEPEVPDSPETPPEKPRKTAKHTTSAESTNTTRHKKN